METISNVQNPNFQNKNAYSRLKTVLNFGNLDFEFVSDFDPPTAGIDRNPALLGRISNLT